MTQAQLATKANTQWQQVSRWERGEAKPRAKALKALAEALEVGLEWLQTGTGQMIPNISEPEGVRIIVEAAAETPEIYRSDSTPLLNESLLREVVQAVLEEGAEGQTPAEIANQVAAAYEFIQRTGKLSKVREVVRMGLS